ncbi:putative MFS family arabinose efflux permease [Kribbella sp. VKM Ac-2527]|uniref:Putative MFS family arabinose efflux permease n=1 Tax=Kribbella caucasensis TaxID=2512215 RepID=A0A4V3C995_9ACTN|nr:MFS transporter [Kribbella sp. VKM Ac-2527]TDO44591.1 putative MFS family arabinose efflux permease [Kribbella sp. VKM Ac-2527]
MSTRATGSVHVPDFHTHRTNPPSPPGELPPAQRRPGFRDTFSALQVRNFRLLVSGLLACSIGGWVQRIAQDWLVLTLTGSATAVGITTALQFLPTLLLGMYGGVIADRFPKRRVLLVTQATMGSIAAILAVLAFTGDVQVWQVYTMALALGLATAVDNPTRQSFVTELVEKDRLRNAISMVSSTFQLGSLIGPALGGAMVGVLGTGWSFAVNAATFFVSISALLRMREHEMPGLNAARKASQGMRIRDGLRDGFRYAVHEPAVRWAIVLVGIFGMFTISLAVTLTAFADIVFNTGATGYGVLNSVVAAGALIGALLSARRIRPTRLRNLVGIASLLAITEMLAAIQPSLWTFLPLLAALGMATLMFLTAAQSMVQLTTPDGLRGRVSGLYNLVFIGGGAIGGPLVGFIAEHWGARVSLLMAGLIPAIATVAIGIKLARAGRFRLILVRTPRSPWHQPPVRLGLEQTPVRIARPESPVPTPSRPFVIGRRRHARSDPHTRPTRTTRRKPLHH